MAKLNKRLHYFLAMLVPFATNLLAQEENSPAPKSAGSEEAAKKQRVVLLVLELLQLQ